MSNRLRPRLTFANVVSCLALFVALGGSAYAVKQLPKNSVGTKQIKKNAVTKKKVRKNAINGPKVKNNSLTGADIKLSKLGTVPSAKNATTASTANLANSIPPAEPTHLVGAPGEPGFEGGSSNVGGGETVNLRPVGFFKDHEGIVHLQGFAEVGTGAPIPRIFTLPPGYRPGSGTVLYQLALCFPGAEPCIKDEPGEDEQIHSLVLVAGGNVDLEGAPLSGGVISGPNRSVSLDGISFRAES